jgi:uncharacterized membrane protein YphA (DoxX/SURF4 family)
MNRLLWVVQIVFGLFFIAIGVSHFVVPEGLPEQAEWMYDLSSGMHAFVGTVEILGGLGLILPSVTRILPWLTPLAAAGLVIVMLGAVVFHVGRDEMTNVATNVVVATFMAFVAYGRLRLSPIGDARRGVTEVRGPDPG